MNCEEFKESLQDLLDSREVRDWPVEMSAHAESCSRCRELGNTLVALHQAMQHLPRVTPPAEMISSLKNIRHRDAPLLNIGWGPEIRLGAQLLLPLLLPYIAREFSLHEMQHILEALMVLLGLTVFGIAALKPMFLGSPASRVAVDQP